MRSPVNLVCWNSTQCHGLKWTSAMVDATDIGLCVCVVVQLGRAGRVRASRVALAKGGREVVIEWKEGEQDEKTPPHRSVYPSDWLHQRALGSDPILQYVFSFSPQHYERFLFPSLRPGPSLPFADHLLYVYHTHTHTHTHTVTTTKGSIRCCGMQRAYMKYLSLKSSMMRCTSPCLQREAIKHILCTCI